MNRLFVILAAICAYTGLLNAQAGTRQIAITPFAEALIVNPLPENQEGTVFIKKIGYFFKPNYQLFLDGGPTLRVSLQYLGSQLDVYYQGEKEVKIIETNWNGTQYVGSITTQESLANAGINEDDLLKALSFVPAMHYPNSNTWAKAPKDAVLKGEVALLIHGEQPAQETKPEEAVASEEAQIDIEKEPTLTEQVLALADQFEEAHADIVVEAPTPEQEAEAIAIFQESLPEELKEVIIESPVDIQPAPEQ